MTFKCMTRFFWLGLIALTLTCGLGAAPAASQANAEGQSSIHVASSSGLHQVVVAHSEIGAQARRDVTRVLSHPEVRAQVKKFGVEPDGLQQKVAVLGDAEILELQRQIMPLVEQMETAAQDDGTRKKILYVAFALIIAALTITMFLFYS